MELHFLEQLYKRKTYINVQLYEQIDTLILYMG